MGQQLADCPIVQWLVLRLECYQVVLDQIPKTVGQFARKSALAAAHDHHVEELLLLRKIALQIDEEGRPAEEIGQHQPEQAVVVK